MSGDQTTRVVVVGGGFAGVACAKRLAGKPGFQVTMLDRNGFHQFQPLLYQVATTELTPKDIAFDLEPMFRDDDNVEVRKAEVVAADPGARTVTLADESVVEGDVVVLAAGSQPNFFHTPGAEEFAFPLYSLDDAERLRSRVLHCSRTRATSRSWSMKVRSTSSSSARGPPGSRSPARWPSWPTTSCPTSTSTWPSPGPG